MVETVQGLIEFNWTSLMILANFLILYIILKKFFWEKIRKFMLDRQNAVKDSLDVAEMTNKRADEKMRAYTERVANVEEEGRQIIKEAKIKADEQAKAIIDEANRDAEQIRLKAEKTIEVEREKAMEQMRQEVAAIAMMAAEKIVEREIGEIGQQAIVDEVINNARKEGWQS